MRYLLPLHNNPSRPPNFDKLLDISPPFLPIHAHLHTYLSEVESLRTSLASRTHFEVLGFGLEAQVLGLGRETFKSSKTSCPGLEDRTIFWLFKKDNNGTKDNITAIIVSVITFYSPSALGQETAKGPFGLWVKLPQADLSTTYGGGFTLSFYNYLTSSREAVNTNFYSVWFDPTGNRTQVYRFRSRRPTK